MKCRIHFHNLPDRKPCFNFLKFLLTVPLIIRQYPATPILSGTGKFYLRFRQFVLFSRFSKHFLRKLRSRKAAHYSWYTFPKFFCIPGCKKQFPKIFQIHPTGIDRIICHFPQISHRIIQIFNPISAHPQPTPPLESNPAYKYRRYHPLPPFSGMHF